jgi:hypothetical protein
MVSDVARGSSTYSRGNPTLKGAATGWPTPTTRDHKGGGEAVIRPDGKVRNDMLDWVAEKWATPTVMDTGVGHQYQYSRGDRSKPVLTLTGQSFSLPDRQITTGGDKPSHIRRTLNPLFVEWLMGWPPGWTFLGLTPDSLMDGTRRGSSGCACSATALSRFRADMRSALFSLGTPPAAPPEQPSFL